jgi:hypothetical protein
MLKQTLGNLFQKDAGHFLHDILPHLPSIGFCLVSPSHLLFMYSVINIEKRKKTQERVHKVWKDILGSGTDST